MHLAQGIEFYANKTVKPEAAIVIQVNESGVNAMVIDCIGRMMTVKNVPVISLNCDPPDDGSFCRSFTGETLGEMTLGEIVVAAELASEDELASTPALETPAAPPAEMAATVLAEAEKLAIEPENK